MKNLRPPSVSQCRVLELYWKNQMLSLLEIYMVWWAFRKSVTSEICLMTPHSYTDVMFDFVRPNFQYSKHFDFQYHIRPPSHDPKKIGRRFNFSCAAALSLSPKMIILSHRTTSPTPNHDIQLIQNRTFFKNKVRSTGRD